MEQLHLPFSGLSFHFVPPMSDGFFLLENISFYRGSPLSRAASWSQTTLAPRKEMTMESIKKDLTQIKTDSFPVVSLFLKWYLCRTTLIRNKKIRRLLEAKDEGKVPDPQQWASLLRLQILGEAFQGLNALLERQLTPAEVANLFERIEEFVQLYAIGLKT